MANVVHKLEQLVASGVQIEEAKLQEIAQELGLSVFYLQRALNRVRNTVPTEAAHKPGFVSYGRVEFPDGLAQGSGRTAPPQVRKDGWAAFTTGDNAVQRRIAPDGSSTAEIDPLPEPEVDPVVGRIKRY